MNQKKQKIEDVPVVRSLDDVFKHLSFSERLKLTIKGIGMSRDSGAYKFAKLQLLLMARPIVAALTVFLVFIVLIMMPRPADDMAQKVVATEIITPDEAPELEPPEPPEFQPQEIDMEVEFTDIAMPTLDNTPVISNEPLSPKPAEMNSVSQVKSPIVMKGILGSRNPGARGVAIGGGGGDAATEAAVLRALRWLKTQQQSDGSWDGNFMGKVPNANTRRNATGFVLLAFLSHGEVPGTSEEFGETVERGLKYLMAQKDPDYMGLYALVEAYALTMNPVIKDAAQKSLKTWSAKIAGGQMGDVLTGAFMAMTLHVAKLAGFELENLDTILDNIAKSSREKGAPLAASSNKGTWHMSFHAIALQYLGMHDDPVVSGVVKKLTDNWGDSSLTLEKLPGYACCPVRANYFVTMLYFNMGGSIWGKWNQTMKNVYVKGQVIESGKYEFKGKAYDVGYWYYDDSSGGEQHAGTQPLISTCYIVQQLMVYYRYSPTHKKKPAGIEDTSVKEVKSAGDVEIKIDW